jgi:hypothetical protein
MSRIALGILALMITGLVVACHDVKSTDTMRVVSPDKIWAATVTSDQHGGPGTAGVITTVRLVREGNPQSKIDILVFEQTGPNSIDLKVGWTDPTHLTVAYKNATLDFQAVKCAGVNISTVSV